MKFLLNILEAWWCWCARLVVSVRRCVERVIFQSSVRGRFIHFSWDPKAGMARGALVISSSSLSLRHRQSKILEDDLDSREFPTEAFRSSHEALLRFIPGLSPHILTSRSISLALEFPVQRSHLIDVAVFQFQQVYFFFFIFFPSLFRFDSRSSRSPRTLRIVLTWRFRRHFAFQSFIWASVELTFCHRHCDVRWWNEMFRCPPRWKSNAHSREGQLNSIYLDSRFSWMNVDSRSWRWCHSWIWLLNFRSM